MQLIQNSYGKSAVRLAKIARHADYHDFKEVHVDIQLEGDFDAVYRHGDNRRVLPTDTMKNTIFALAKDHPLQTIEAFGLYLADYFLRHNAQLDRVALELTQVRWDRLYLHGEPHAYTFLGGGGERAFARVEADAGGIRLQSGLRGLRILKTTQSSFENYIVDQFTTLPPAADRILATELEARWDYRYIDRLDFQQVRDQVRETLLSSFAGHVSASVQHTLYAMGEAALNNVEVLSEISLVMPNLHYLPVNMKPFNLENVNEVFLASGDAYGYITGTLRRE
jgi:urate oxidase